MKHRHLGKNLRCLAVIWQKIRGHLLERTIQDQPEGAVLWIVVADNDDGAAEIGIAQDRMCDQQPAIECAEFLGHGNGTIRI